MIHSRTENTRDSIIESMDVGRVNCIIVMDDHFTHLLLLLLIIIIINRALPH